MKYVRGIDFKPSREEELRRRCKETKRISENLRALRDRDQLRYKRGWYNFALQIKNVNFGSFCVL